MTTVAKDAPGAKDGATDGNADDGTDDGTDDGKTTFTKAEVDARIAGIASKNRELIGKNKTLRDRNDAFGDLDPAKVRELVDKEAKAVEDAAKAAGRFDELRETLNKSHQVEMGKVTEKLTRRETQLFKIVATKEALTELGKVTEYSAALLPTVEKYLRVAEDGEEFVVRVVDAKGSERLGPRGEPMTVSELLAEMATKPEFEKLFIAPTASGSGARGSRTGAATGDVRISRADAQDTTKYRAASAEAKKRGTQLLIGD